MPGLSGASGQRSICGWRQGLKSDTHRRDTLVKKLKAVMLVAAMAMGAQVAQAANSHVNISYADLDLGRTEGAAVLYGKIHQAAETVCEPLDGRSLRENANFRACVSDAVARAVSQVNKPTLTDYYLSKLGARDRSFLAASR
jgi:UrcA family protein